MESRANLARMKCEVVTAVLLAWAALAVPGRAAGTQPARARQAQSAPTAQAQSAPAGVPRYYYPVPPAGEPLVVEADVCVYGSTPAGVTAAALAIEGDLPVQKVPYDQLRQRLLADKQVLAWPAAGDASSAPAAK